MGNNQGSCRLKACVELQGDDATPRGLVIAPAPQPPAAAPTTPRGATRELAAPALVSDAKESDAADEEIDFPDADFNRQYSTSVSNLTTFNFVDARAADSKNQAQSQVFSWLRWAPHPGSKCYKALHRYFPGALPGEAMHSRAAKLLQSPRWGFNSSNTILGTSICPDEINSVIGTMVDLMKEHWGGMCFPMGGISGAPFSGKTGFVAFSHHVPDDGNVFVVFGPHVGISEEGEVSKCYRHGIVKQSTACGALVGAYNACIGGAADVEFDRSDMQMSWIKSQIAPHADEIKRCENPMALLAHQAYEYVKDMVLAVVNNDFGSGHLAVLGGIMINMPDGYSDHFLPLMFQINKKGEDPTDLMSVCQEAPTGDLVNSAPADHRVWAWMDWSPQPDSALYRSLHANFEGALPGRALHSRITHALQKRGVVPSNSIFGTSLCPDEINSRNGELVEQMKTYWGDNFPLGGISGAPFAGKTGFTAFSHHVPDDGNVIVLYGPHVGMTEDGVVGKVLRAGQDGPSTACGAAVGAWNAALGTYNPSAEFNKGDMQMDWFKQQIAPHAQKIKEQGNPMAALAHQAYTIVADEVEKVVSNGFGDGYLVLIGVIQINMPQPCYDHFLPVKFEVRNKEQHYDLLPEIQPHFAHSGDHNMGA